MRHPVVRICAFLLAGMAVGLAACQSASLSPSGTQRATPVSASASPADASSAAAATSAPSSPPAAGASPTTAAGAAFACEPLEIHDTADQTHTLIADVRVGTHDGYDRFVVEFGPPFPGAPAGVPEYIIRAAEPPLTQDPSAQPMDVPGSHHLLLALLGATKYDQDFTLRYTGPTRFDPGYPTLVAAYERGDFEATISWYLGLDQEPCFRVYTLTDPMRLVVDVAH